MEDQPDKPKPARQPDKRKVRRTGQRTKVGKDKWLLRVPLGKVDKKRRTHTETFHGSANQAEDRIREVLRRHRTGEPITVNRDSFDSFVDEWLESKKLGVAESSLRLYKKIVELYIRPHFGKMMMSAIKAEDIQRAYNKMREGDKDKERGPLGLVTIHHIHTILGMIFKLAVLRKKLSGSPMVGVVLPRGEDSEVKEPRAMSAEQVQVFLEASRGSRFEYLFRLAFHVGCRPGELLALQWANLEAQAIRINQSIVWRKAGDWYLKTTKTKLSRRTIPLTDAMIDLLLEQKEWQAAARLKAGKLWNDDGFIFTTEFGRPYALWHLRDDFKLILKRAGLPLNFNPYSARHTMATLLIAGGADIKSVSERLGHASPTMTLDVYAHVLPGRQALMSEKIERLLDVGNAQDTNTHLNLTEPARNQLDTSESV